MEGLPRRSQKPLDRTSTHRMDPHLQALRDYNRLLASFEPDRLPKWHNGPHARPSRVASERHRGGTSDIDVGSLGYAQVFKAAN